MIDLIPFVLILAPLDCAGFCFTLAFLRADRLTGQRLLIGLACVALIVAFTVFDLAGLDPYDTASYGLTGLISGGFLALVYTAIGALGSRPELYTWDEEDDRADEVNRGGFGGSHADE